MIEIAMFPSIVLETAVMIRSDMRCQRSEPRGSSRVSTAPISRGRSIIRNSVRKIAVTRASTRLNPLTTMPIRPPAALATPCAISFTFAWAVSGAELCSSIQEPNDELVVMSSTMPGSASTKSLKLPASGESSSRVKTTARAVSPRISVVAHAPRPSGQVTLHQAHDGLEHERHEQRQEEREHRVADVDEGPRQGDDRGDEQHRANGEVDAQPRAVPARVGSERGRAA